MSILTTLVSGLGSGAGSALGSSTMNQFTQGAMNLGFSQANDAMNKTRALRFYKRQARFDREMAIKRQIDANRIAVAWATPMAVAHRAAMVRAGINPDAGDSSVTVSNAQQLQGSSASLPSGSSFQLPTYDPSSVALSMQQSRNYELQNEGLEIDNQTRNIRNLAEINQLIKNADLTEEQKNDLIAKRDASIQLLLAQQENQLSAATLSKSQADTEEELRFARKEQLELQNDFQKVNIQKVLGDIESGKISSDILSENLTKLRTDLNNDQKRKDLGLPSGTSSFVIGVLESPSLAHALYKLSGSGSYVKDLKRKNIMNIGTLSSYVQKEYGLSDSAAFKVANAYLELYESNKGDTGATNNLVDRVVGNVASYFVNNKIIK